MPALDQLTSSEAGDDLALLREAAREAGAIAMGYFGNNPQVWMKGGTSPVSEADHAADAYLRETLLNARPDYGWLSEETADDHARLSARRTFVVDPIDGTRGFLDGLHSWCVSVAVVEDGRSLAGVLECPAKHETYWALPGEGAYLNDKRIHVRPLGQSVDIGGPKTLVDLMPEVWHDRLRRAAYIPSLAYRLAMIAAGKLDAAFVKPNAHDWDIAAADLILAEAGGALLDRAGKPPRYAGEVINHGALAAGSGELLGVLAGVIARIDQG
ncbi:3'(2'),5'-bisphosphate nucleotidase CysQ [Mesorhizobium sp. M2A.F.Ca.ET.037.01.1.1]|uniref:3'(2'),5'-bisphosphate nucleotidase CysQ n=1 Tax=unclassified Mesorhizobium TaxID=325217 RepID=UPI000F75B619|nr:MULTISPECIES: 3'(2'),5'-bisphosphate nucleotidase CysQ [unclassified Mesorhizobium]RVC63778.1 3'(2'),5'-bisphosphate nucleotidase CysQ [Mesorhizobium sp. M00.F.Ca.ET.038.03.1.1]RVC67192.1 3'(2'),5'-bisphosphate nucleotidase CysQ [Mesorhizobium sp. M2A.F.Ca.ET.046.02.1.1]AZO38893.1 3'(2'),5'-bisphosphate nucleotidase CysQ [Mesorhizobium sp. M2A.F.Ca.ET.046.03.2.1]RUX20818.1 3'(2'),5'-bisphosphate nucleotidase CysQ [Mesorhizobium sp. M2A.F.Ca.ET.037.01.1.1]RWA87800.1 MAG: 3'(2'),5'-bisphospha